jgi:hypothetical protein
MKHNVGTTDRWLRALVVAPVLVLLALLVGAGSVLGIILFVVAAVMVATAVVGFCPLYSLLHVDTCRTRTGGV